MRAAERFSLAALASRGGHPEAWHFAAAAVVTADGRLVARLGDPEIEVLPRSGVKPFQAMPLVAGGGCERFALEAADLALICGSHSGTEAHVERVERLLAAGGLAAADLGCASHPPLDAGAAERLREAGEAPGPLHNNCSGKHAGMLLACRLLELDGAGYLAPDHPLQRRIVEQLRRFARLGSRPVEMAIDGCGAPAPRLALIAAARAYAALADPAGAGLDGPSRAVAERLVEAMTSWPEMVAGPGRFTTRLMEVTGGRVLGKEGAAGFYAAAVRGPVALGLALKIADGTEACRDGVVLETLRQLGSLSGEELESLESYYRRTIRNWSGVEVGELTPALELEETRGAS